MPRKSKDPKHPVERKQMADAVKTFIPQERDAFDVYSAVKRQAKVAAKNIRVLPNGEPDWQTMTVHQKMKVAQDFLVGVFLSPEIGVRFVEQAMEDPMAAAKLAVALMPKELHVDVENRTGVIMVPMREENFEQWQARVTNQAKTIGNASHDWKDILPGDDSGPVGDSVSVDGEIL